MSHAEQGSASIEAAVGVPAFVLFVGLIIFAGRHATAHQAVESAAADAARSASIARSASAAKDDATVAARTSLDNQNLDCLTIDVTVDSGQFSRPAGELASVDVTVSCQIDLSDLSVPGVPGSRTLEATVTSPLDTYRGRS